MYIDNEAKKAKIGRINVSVRGNSVKIRFPSPKGKYITWNNVRNRHWIPIIEKLREQDKLDRYIKPYSLRHSAITRWLREGISIASVAKLSGNSVKVIMENYWKAETGFDIPLL